MRRGDPILSYFANGRPPLLSQLASINLPVKATTLPTVADFQPLQLDWVENGDAMTHSNNSCWFSQRPRWWSWLTAKKEGAWSLRQLFAKRICFIKKPTTRRLVFFFHFFLFFGTEEKIRNYPHVLAETLKMQALFADSVACWDFLCANFPTAMAMEAKLGA